MAKLDEIDILKLQNITLRIDNATKERDLLVRDLLTKHGVPGTSLRIANDGTIIPDEEPAPVVDPAV